MAMYATELIEALRGYATAIRYLRGAITADTAAQAGVDVATATRAGLVAVHDGYQEVRSRAVREIAALVEGVNANVSAAAEYREIYSGETLQRIVAADAARRSRENEVDRGLCRSIRDALETAAREVAS